MQHAPTPTALSRRLLPAAALSLVPIGEYHSALEIGLVVAFLVLSLALHEVAHGWTALKLGDPTARDLGRLSLNPLVHIDLVWSILIPIVALSTGGFLFGGAKPVPVDYMRLRRPLRDMSIVAAAGPLTNLVLAIALHAAWKLAVHVGPYEADQLLPRVLAMSMLFNIVLFIFNLIPIPPLDGSRIMTWLLPAKLRVPYASLERMGMFLILVLLMFFPPFHNFLRAGILSTKDVIDQLTGGAW